MKEEKTFAIDKSSKFFISIIGIVVIFIVLKELQTIFIPFVIAYFLFFVFKPVNDFLIKKKIPYYVAIILDLLIIVFLIGGITSIIAQSFADLGAQLPEYERKLNHVVSSTAASWSIDEPSIRNFNASRFLKSMDYGGIAEGFFSSTFSALGTFLFIVFFFIFINTGHKHILKAIENYYANEDNGEGEESKFSIEETANNITEKIQKYLVGKLLLSLLIGFIYAVILWLFGVDFFIVWGTITFVLNFVPNIGSLISGILPALMSLVQYESFGYTLVIIIVLLIVENITGNFIEPKVLGSSLGLNPLIILLSFLLWGYIWGVVGAILSIPLTSIFKIIIANSQSNKLKFLHELLDSK